MSVRGVLLRRPTDDLIESALQEAPVAEATRAGYLAALSKLRRISLRVQGEGGHTRPLTNFLEWRGAPDAVRAHGGARSSQATLVAVVLAVMKHLRLLKKAGFGRAVEQRWRAAGAEFDAEAELNQGQNKLSVREEDGWISLSEALAAERAMRTSKKFTGVPENHHLVLALHILWPPLRGGDLGRVRLVGKHSPCVSADAHADADGEAQCGNTIMWDGHELGPLILREYKTRAIGGVLVRVVPDDLKTLIRASLNFNEREYLLESEQGPFSTEKAANGWILKQLRTALGGRRVTVNALRHAYISAIDFNETPVATLRAIAHEMGHSLARQSLYRRIRASPPNSPARSQEPAALNVVWRNELN